MPRFIKISGVDRIIDANINRAKEGLRVCEEIARFIINNKALTAYFKGLRHKIDNAASGLITLDERLRVRKSLEDVGKDIRNVSELQRRNYKEIFSSNIQRAKEAIRVLEEFSKLKNIRSTLKFKKIRYSLYELEKKTLTRFPALCSFRQDGS